MIFLSILIALLLERMFPQFVELRRFDWLREYSQWMQDVLHIERFGAWISLGVLLFPLILLVWVIAGMVGNALFGLFELAFNVAVIFFCIGPKELDKQVDQYLDAVELGETQQRYQVASELSLQPPSMDLPAQAVQVCKSLFVLANVRVFAVLFWFVVLGPVAAVVYRVLQQLQEQQVIDDALSAMKPVVRQLQGWIDWLPTRISLFGYMISGNFDEALQAYRSGSPSAIDLYEENNEMLQNVGFSAISSHEAATELQAMALVRKTRGLFLRSLVVWLLILLPLSVLG
jgi:membrane protein required for beta-lactamase induction